MQLQVPEYEKLLALQARRTVKANEIQFLSWMGSQVPDVANIVEIGSYRGTSTIAIALGARSANKLFALYAIDLWLKGSKAKYTQPEIFIAFKNNIRLFGLEKNIIPIMASSQEAQNLLHFPIDLLFIDGNHIHRYVNYDYVNWGKRIKAGGRIALHDYKAGLPGVDMVVASAIASNLWENKEIVDSIWSAMKK